MKHERNTLQKHRETIKRLNEDLRDENTRTGQWIEYASDLEDKLKVAIDRLKLIADGKFYTGESFAWETDKDKITATTGLAKLARMRERKP